MNDRTTELFGEPVYRYSRQQAIEDGVLVDLSIAITPCPFKYPVAMTRTAYAATIEAGGTYTADPDDNEGGEVLKLPRGQDVRGRLHDVFWMLQLAIRQQTGPADRVHFSVRVDTQGNGRRTQVDLYSVCGPGDTEAPVITIMLEGED